MTDPPQPQIPPAQIPPAQIPPAQIPPAQIPPGHEVSEDFPVGSIYGLLAEFSGADQLIEAATQIHGDGFTSTDAFTPFPIEEVSNALGVPKTPMPWYILGGGILGGVLIYTLEWWINVIAYPINVGGRPLHSWPAFIPPTFECTVLLASLTGLIGMIIICGLPRLHHPLFAIERFKKASTDGFFLCVLASDVKFDESKIRARLLELGAVEVWHVPSEH